MAQRKWWAEQWPEGESYIAGLVAQDVQDALFETTGRWPLCHDCSEEAPVHTLFIQPDLGGPDPVWVCEESGRRRRAPRRALIGGLTPPRPPAATSCTGRPGKPCETPR